MPLYTTSRLREGYAEASRNVGQPTRGIISPQVPTQRLRGPTRTGRQPAGALAVKMRSKKTLLIIGVSFQIFCCSRKSVMNRLVNKASMSAGSGGRAFACCIATEGGGQHKLHKSRLWFLPAMAHHPQGSKHLLRRIEPPKRHQNTFLWRLEGFLNQTH